jgi:hypothetical protein
MDIFNIFKICILQLALNKIKMSLNFKFTATIWLSYEASQRNTAILLHKYNLHYDMSQHYSALCGVVTPSLESLRGVSAVCTQSYRNSSSERKLVPQAYHRLMSIG